MKILMENNMSIQKSLFEYKSRTTEYFKKEDEAVEKNLLEKIKIKNALENDNKNLPEISEMEIARHFTNLTKEVYGVDNGIYPLGSCTMKYNPKITEKIAGCDEFNNVHPYSDLKNMQGFLKVMFDLERMLAEISGMAYTSLTPCAGAHGEFTGLLIIDKYHKFNGDYKRNKVILPNTAHGTNPASASVAGLESVEIPTNSDGSIDLKILEENLDETVSAFMLTNPSTLGFFEKNILEIADMVHKKGALLYYDGANLNPLLGIARPGDMGFDVMHFNLHKTFATPHGGGGAGSGPVAVKDFLKDFLPQPRISFCEKSNEYFIDERSEKNIGKVRSYFGNFQVILKAYIYILMLGNDGLREAGEKAILNANYLLARIKQEGIFNYPFGEKTCMHEFVLSGDNFKDKHIKTLDIAKRMIDYGIHPPTIYFPLIVHEAMMFEPTETESLDEMDKLLDILAKIKAEIMNDPEKVINAPLTRKVGRLDEVKAVKDMNFIYKN
jgi:glycine dehydrogenase subunit 2